MHLHFTLHFSGLGLYAIVVLANEAGYGSCGTNTSQQPSVEPKGRIVFDASLSSSTRILKFFSGVRGEFDAYPRRPQNPQECPFLESGRGQTPEKAAILQTLILGHNSLANALFEFIGFLELGLRLFSA